MEQGDESRPVRLGLIIDLNKFFKRVAVYAVALFFIFFPQKQSI